MSVSRKRSPRNQARSSSPLFALTAVGLFGLAVGGSLLMAGVFRGLAATTVAPAPTVAVVDEQASAPIDDPAPIVAARSMTIAAVGDVMLSRGAAAKIQRRGVDYCFEGTADVLQAADLAFANLETPITPGRIIRDDDLTLRSDPSVVAGLVTAGFDVLSLANNHVPNFGATGIRDTVRFLDAAGLHHAGAGDDLAAAEAPAWLDVQGTRAAVLAFNDTDVVPPSYGAADRHPGTAFMDVERMRTAVQAARQQADYVVVSMHAGVEYVDQPNDSQRQFARAAIEAGADLVIGHHPHVVQPVERYGGKLILYSLGNFVFDQPWSRDTREGALAFVTLRPDAAPSYELKPVLIEDICRPRFLVGAEAEDVLARMPEVSQ